MTRLLVGYLRGKCRTTVLATVSPTAFNLTESVCTMEFAQNAAAFEAQRICSDPATGTMSVKELRVAKDAAEERCVRLEAKLQVSPCPVLIFLQRKRVTPPSSSRAGGGSKVGFCTVELFVV